MGYHVNGTEVEGGGFSCFIAAFVQSGRGVVVLTNSDSGTPLIKEWMSAISRQYHWPQMPVGAP